jgi:hypothetical protein
MTQSPHHRTRGAASGAAAPGAARAAGAGPAAGSPAPELALIVCTRDRAGFLRETLAALAAVRAARPWELVLVNNGSRDATPTLLARFAAEAARAPAVPGAPGAVVVVREPRAGLGRAHNAGVRAARAPVLCFTDDDCYPAPDFIDRWGEVFDDPAVGYAGGTIELYDPDDYPITIRPTNVPDRRRAGAYVEAGLVQGANMAFRRDLVVAAGGFDPDLGPGGVFNCEDLDMAARVSALGAAGGYFPGPKVWHHHRRRAGPGIRALERSYAHGIGAYRTSLLFRASTRKHGLWTWGHMLREAVHYRRNERHRDLAAREFAGAVHYLAYRLVRPFRRRRE